MAGLKEIKRRLKSVRNTRKITYAMKLVSAAKLRKAQDAVTHTRGYTDALIGLMLDLVNEQQAGESLHPLFEPHETVRRVRLLVVGGSRGLCGGYNANLNRMIDGVIAEQKRLNPAIELDYVVIGKKPAEYFRRIKRGYLQSYEGLPEDPYLWPIDEFATELERAYLEDRIDEAYVVYTRFRSALSVAPAVEKVLPFSESVLPSEGATRAVMGQGVTLFEPSLPEVLAALLPRILRGRILQAALDAKASEHGSRMTAMDSATKNAGELMQRLQLLGNKLRQSGITAELLDIIGGANAVEQ